MLTQILMFILGLAALVLGGESLVRGASRLALSVGISPLVVGLTIVALGTSAPEAAVGVGAVLQGTMDLAVGNVVGSNIFNILFVLGLSALIAPLVVDAQLVRQEVPIMVGVSLLMVALVLDGRVSRWDAALLFGLLMVYTVFLVVQSRRQSQQTQAEYTEGFAPRDGWDRHWSVQVLLVLAGLGLLVLGSDWLVGAAVAFARALGISDAIVGLTIVAMGTSLPEVATSLTAVLRGERDIAVGNVVGSNIFNLLGSLGLSGLVASGGLLVPRSVLNFDLWVMLAVAVACLPVFFTGRRIARWEGGMFLGYYVAYTAYLVLDTKEHELLGAYSRVMLGFVLPLTVVTLAVLLVRSLRRPADGGEAP